jgi:hypothetical protein
MNCKNGQQEHIACSTYHNNKWYKMNSQQTQKHYTHSTTLMLNQAGCVNRVQDLSCLDKIPFAQVMGSLH